MIVSSATRTAASPRRHPALGTHGAAEARQLGSPGALRATNRTAVTPTGWRRWLEGRLVMRVIAAR
jgi:hypothetical protein